MGTEKRPAGNEAVQKLLRAELIFVKSRNGPTGAEEIRWVPEPNYFTEVTEGAESRFGRDGDLAL